MKNNMIIKTTIILLLLGSSISLAGERQFKNELEFSNPSLKKVLQIGGNGDLNITGYNGNKVLISAGEDIFEEADRSDEKAKGLKKIRGGGFNIINNTKDNIIFITRSVSNDVDLDIKVPNGITLKLGNGIVVKKQNYQNQDKKRVERKEEQEQKEEGPVDIDVIINKSVQSVQKMMKNFNVQIPPVHVRTGFGLSGIIDGDISIRDFTGVIEVNTVNGNIIAENISGEAVASTVDGDIKISFSNLSKDRDQYFSTVDGDIDITLPKETKADILARTMDGDVYTGFDVDLTYGGETENGRGSVSHNFYNPYYNSNFITARINGGGNKVYLNTIDGNIYIRKGE
jgi:hypothetical protein